MTQYTRIALGILFAILSSTASANGFYVGLGGAYNAIRGDFDGQRGFNSINYNDTILAPKLDGAWGGTIFGGYNFTSKAAFEIGLTTSQHDASYGNRKATADYTAVDFNLKYYFLDVSALRPYGLAGIGVYSIDAKDASLVYNTNTVNGDVTYYGSGLNFGLGVDFFVTEHISAGLGATYRFVTYSGADSPGASGSLTSNLSGDGYTVTLNTIYHF